MSSSNNSSSSEESLSTLVTKVLKEKEALAHELELIGVPPPVFLHDHDSASGSITPMPSTATSPLVSSVSSHNDDSDIDKDYLPGVQGGSVLSIPSSSSGSDIRPLKRKRRTSKPTRRSPRKHASSKAKRSPRKPTRRSPRKHVQPTSQGT